MSRPSDPLLRGLVDDAALFPPGNAPMDAALAEHAGHRGAWYADMVGPFLCPASRIDELSGALPAGQQIQLALVNDVTGAGALHARAVALTMSSLAWLETRHGQLGEDARSVSGGSGRSGGAPFAFLEVPRTGFEPAFDLIGEEAAFHAAKYRTGGLTQDAYPNERELAAFLVAVTERDLPFKLTAGLHHAVRGTDPTSGLDQHGLLNVLVATRVAQQGGGVAEVAAVLVMRDPAPLLAFAEGWDDATCADVRRSFRSFGCCGVTDPIDELVTLGLLEGN